MNSEKIKVIHIITMLELGGAQQTTLYTLAHLDRARYVPALICGPGGILLSDAESIPDISLSICDDLIRRVSPFHDLRAIARLKKILLREKLAHQGTLIVHTHSSKAGIVGRWAAYLAGIPFILHTVHGFGFHPYQCFPLKWGFILSEILTGLITRKTIYVSKDNLREGIRLGISPLKKSCIIRSGIEWERFSQVNYNSVSLKREFGIPEDAKVVGMIACFKPQKSPLDFILMAYRVSLELPDVHFLLVGDGILRTEIKRMILELGLQGKVHLSGWRRDIPNILGMMDIMALTSLWEGLPKVVVEAQVMGVPVVATNTSGVEEVVRDGVSGFLTPPKKPNVMAYKVIGLLKSPDALRKMGQEAKSVPREFDLNEVVIRHDELYTLLIDGI